jgi:hypothetical protein
MAVTVAEGAKYSRTTMRGLWRVRRQYIEGVDRPHLKVNWAVSYQRQTAQ